MPKKFIIAGLMFFSALTLLILFYIFCIVLHKIPLRAGLIGGVGGAACEIIGAIFILIKPDNQ
jgi:hypothetical protein